MLRIGICDDECYARDALRLELEKLLEETEEIVYEFSGGETAVSWLKKHPGEIDLLFLDVEMKGVNGIRTAEQIREFDTRIQIVFVTGFRDFVFEGYRVQAVDYLVKPVDADRLSSVLSRVRRQLGRLILQKTRILLVSFRVCADSWSRCGRSSLSFRMGTAYTGFTRMKYSIFTVRREKWWR